MGKTKGRVQMPTREEVYQSWLAVQQLEAMLELAKKKHVMLFNLRYVHGGKLHEEPLFVQGAPS